MACRTWEQYEQYLIQQFPLTRREVQITIECIKGHANKEIATTLGIAAETVNKTLDRVYRTMKVSSRYQLVANLLVADIEATPLQQSLILAGEGAALVAAGFMATVNSARGYKKRPRSGKVLAPDAKSTLNQSRLRRLERERHSVKKGEELAAAAGAAMHTADRVVPSEETPNSDEKAHQLDLCTAGQRKDSLKVKSSR